MPCITLSLALVWPSVTKGQKALTTPEGNPKWSYEHNFKKRKGVYMKDISNSTKKATELLQLLVGSKYASNNDYVIKFSLPCLRNRSWGVR
jgi:hypothetical protein